MLYQLVLITNLGVITPVATFHDRLDCLRERGMIQQSSQYSTACLPSNSPDEVMRQNEQSMRQMMQMFRNMTQEMKEIK